jgi:ABC-type lipoprotein export system ATPase subunit
VSGKSTPIELRDVFRIYDAPEGASVALQGLSLTAADGEILVVLGPSGSGKSTLLRIASGLDRPSAGIARTLGVDLGRLRASKIAAFRAENLGILDQHYARSLSPDLTCRETIGLRLALEGRPRSEWERRADELLERVGLRDRADARPASLSGGEQQRVAVCAALAHGPRLLLADEPGGELDAASAEAVYALVGELVRELGATALVVSHDPGATAIADRLVTIRDGRLGEESVPGGEGTLVVGRGGWVRLPGALLHEAGIGSHATARAAESGVLLRPIGNVRDPVEAAGDVPTRPTNGNAVAVLDGVEKRYGEGESGRVVLDGLDASFYPGRLALVVGRSGSGKTTLLNLLAGLARSTRGEVVLFGEPVSAQSREQLAKLRRRRIGVVGQEPGLVPFLSAAENVALSLSLREPDEPDPIERSREALAALGVEGRADQRADRLSAGERQRVAIARALAHRPHLLLADEPTARLDEENAHSTAALLLRAARAYETAVVCATHDPALLAVGDDELRLG